MKINRIILFIIILYIICLVAKKYRHFFQKIYRPIKTNEEPYRSSNIHNIFESKNIPFKMDKSCTNIEELDPIEIINDKSIQTETIPTQDKLIQTDENIN
jgi:hypothetical protein